MLWSAGAAVRGYKYHDKTEIGMQIAVRRMPETTRSRYGNPRLCRAIALAPDNEKLLRVEDATQPSDPTAWASEREAVNAGVRARRTPILFLHVHKSGGTSLCEAARTAKLRTETGERCQSSGDRVTTSGVWAPVYGKNCNPVFVDRHDAWGGNGPDAMLSYAVERKLDFFAMETTRPSILPWGSIALLVVVRHPLHRLMSRCSRLKALLQPSANYTRWLPWRDRAGNAAPLSAESEESLRECACQVRGTLVEELAGAPGGGADRRVARGARVRRADVARASRFLERASIVLVTDRLNEAGALLNSSFGWRSGVPRLSPAAAQFARSRNSLAFRPGRRLSSSNGDDTAALHARFERAAPAMHALFISETRLELSVYQYASRIFDTRLKHLRSGGDAKAIADEARVWATAPDRTWRDLPDATPLGPCPRVVAPSNESMTAKKASSWVVARLHEAMIGAWRR